MAHVVFVRPYRDSIRTAVEASLRAAGLDLQHVHAIPKGTPDARVLAELRGMRTPDVLVVPFHPHRDDAGNDVNGLGVASQLRAALPALASVPFLMPVAQAGRAGFMMALERSGAVSWPSFHVLHEDELADPAALGARLKAAGVGTRPA